MAIIVPKITEADVHAVRAVTRGTATADQQQRAMKWIAEEVCRIWDSPYVPGPEGARDTDFAAARHWCGTMIGNMMTQKTLDEARKADTSAGVVTAAEPVKPSKPARQAPRVNTKRPK